MDIYYNNIYTMQKIKNILIQVFYFIWQLPQVIVALIMLPFLGKKTFIRKENYCWIYECEKMSGGISLGCFIFLSPYSAKKEATIRHELGHVKQSHILGPIFLLVIGIPSIMWAWLGDDDKCYYSFYTESWSNHLMGLKVKHNQYNCYIYIPADKEKEE